MWCVSLRTVQRRIAEGQLPAVRLPGGHYRVRAEDVAGFRRLLKGCAELSAGHGGGRRPLGVRRRSRSATASPLHLR